MPRELVLPYFAHNPKPLVTADGTVLLYHIGCGGPLHKGDVPYRCYGLGCSRPPRLQPPSVSNLGALH